MSEPVAVEHRDAREVPGLRQICRAATLERGLRASRRARLAAGCGLRRDADRLTQGTRLAGPAIIESVNTSVFVPRGWRAEYDALDNCILSK